MKKQDDNDNKSTTKIEIMEIQMKEKAENLKEQVFRTQRTTHELLCPYPSP